MADTLLYTGVLKICSCWCGIQLAVPDDLYKHAQDSVANRLYCPLGHVFVFRKGDAQVERERADRLARQLENERTYSRSVQDQLAASERSKAAIKGHLTRYRNRVANGVCPVQGCKRHFLNVQRHVADEHPGWVESHPEVFA